MVTARENRARVTCRPVGPPHPGPAPELARVDVVLAAAEPVEGWADLLSPNVGRTMAALVPQELADRSEQTWQGFAELVAPGLMRFRS